ncbi:MAG TPA: hypothetical protein VGZ22_00445 [Isosphaeraceae bacterium]|jgi:hypothetical protein|nr:hypothetical protein [Isosphaeraceae bacterium]
MREHAAGHHDDHDAERRALVATTVAVGLLLATDLRLAAWGGEASRWLFEVPLALFAAVIGGGRVAVARAVHVQQVGAELTPADKAAWVQRHKHDGCALAMVGDGIHDAPALALAHGGTALRGGGTDFATPARS